jgi:hypothetical protein
MSEGSRTRRIACLCTVIGSLLIGGWASRAQALNWLTVWSWGTAGNNGADLDVGPDNDRTCFLMGIHGSLKAYPGVNGSPFSKASAGVYRINGRWKVRTRAGHGPGVSAQVACILATGNRVELSVTEGDSPSSNPSVPATPNRQCFLTSVYAVGHGWDAYLSDWPFGPPGVGIDVVSGKWVFHEWLNPNSSEQASGGASAVCVDVPMVGLKNFHSEAPANTSITKELFQNDGGWVCGLSSLLGVFMDSWSKPGAEVFLNSTNNWSVSIANRREVNVKCVK